MPIKNIVLIVGGRAGSAAARTWTRALASQQGAHLTMALIGEAAERPVDERGDDPAITVLRHQALDDDWPIKLARYNDLAVIGWRDADEATQGTNKQLIERLGQVAGCPLLVLPARIASDRVARRIAVAWNGSAPAQRALRAALPLLAKADAVAIVTVHSQAPLDVSAPLRGFLERHGINATFEPIVGDEGNAGPLVAQALGQLDAELLVMGAWSQPVLTQWLLGSATRHLLDHVGIPILLSA